MAHLLALSYHLMNFPRIFCEGFFWGFFVDNLPACYLSSLHFILNTVTSLIPTQSGHFTCCQLLISF